MLNSLKSPSANGFIHRINPVEFQNSIILRESPLLTLFISVAGIHLLASMLPGPDFLYVSSTSAAKSRQAALAGVLGITAGVALWAFVALTGLTVLLHRIAWLQHIIQVFGGIFLCWTGLQLMRNPGKQYDMIFPDSRVELFQIRKVFLRGFLTNMSNPKVLVYFTSVFSLFSGDQIPFISRWLLLAMMVIISFIWFYLVARVFSLAKVRHSYRKYISKINKTAGVLFTGFGLHLIFSR